MVEAAGFRYIPKGAIKVADKNSDAVAYLFPSQSGNGKPAMKVFYGKQSKPVAYFVYPDEAQRAQRVAEFFKARQDRAAYMAQRRAKRIEAAKAGKVQVGAYFYTSWGYDQTNIDWYRVEALIGKTMALVTQVKAMDASDGDAAWMTGKSVPSETPVGEPFKVRLNGDGFKVDGRNYANIWDGKPKNWTAYA